VRATRNHDDVANFICADSRANINSLIVDKSNSLIKLNQNFLKWLIF
jgi:hypothetical protein